MSKDRKPEAKEKAIKMAGSGKSIAAIARECGVAWATADRWVKETKTSKEAAPAKAKKKKKPVEKIIHESVEPTELEEPEELTSMEAQRMLERASSDLEAILYAVHQQAQSGCNHAKAACWDLVDARLKINGVISWLDGGAE